MKMQDEYIEELIRLAEDAIWEGDYTFSRGLLDKGLEEEPGYPQLHYTLGWMYHYYQVNKPLAERHYKLALYFDSDYLAAYQGLAEFYFSGRRWLELRDLMNVAVTSEEVDRDFVYETLGKVNEKEGRFREAVKYYRKALLSCTDNCQTEELRQSIKRIRYKRFKTRFKRWNSRIA